MADAPDVSGKSLEELEEEITCILCKRHYQEAKLLPCMHYYCKPCIEELARRSKPDPFPCPECRKEVTLPSAGVDQLQSAFFVERIKDVYGKMAKRMKDKAEESGVILCEMCSKWNSIAFCHYCVKFTCRDCVCQHQPPEGPETCRVLMLEKDSSVDASLPSPSNCPVHGDPMTVFCFSCNCIVCRDCIVSEHSGHTFNLLKKSASEKRRELCNALSPLRILREKIANAVEELTVTQSKVDTQENEVCQSIQESFTQLKVKLEKQEIGLIGSAVKLAREKKDILAAQKFELQTTETVIQSVIEYVEQNLEEASDQNLMSSHMQLQAKVKEEEKRHQKLSLKPATSANVACYLPSLDVIPERLGSVFSCVGLPSVLVVVPTTASVGTTVQFNVKVLQKRGANLEAELTSLIDPCPVVTASVKPFNADTFIVSFTPTVRGRSNLALKIDGKPIHGSPFRILVSIKHPSTLGTPVRILEGFHQPWGLAFNNEGQLLVAECGTQKVVVVEKDGTPVKTITCNLFKSPRGIAVGTDGSIFVTNFVRMSGYTCLVKLDRNGSELCHVASGLKGAMFCKIINNLLYVCTRGEVKIFDNRCQCLGGFPTQLCPQAHDIAMGNNSLYVVNHANPGKIGVYTLQGCFQEKLDVEVDLVSPRGIFVDANDYIFVTQTAEGGEGVYVFNASGDFMSNFGFDVLKAPSGITFDEDGFVYVSDFNQGHIVVF